MTLTESHETLGIPANATLAEIRAAYRKLSLKYHPDRSGTDSTRAQFQAIQEAYEVLSQMISQPSGDKSKESKTTYATREKTPFAYSSEATNTKRHEPGAPRRKESPPSSSGRKYHDDNPAPHTHETRTYRTTFRYPSKHDTHNEPSKEKPYETHERRPRQYEDSSRESSHRNKTHDTASRPGFQHETDDSLWEDSPHAAYQRRPKQYEDATRESSRNATAYVDRTRQYTSYEPQMRSSVPHTPHESSRNARNTEEWQVPRSTSRPERYHDEEDVHHSVREAGPQRHYYYYPRESPADQRPVSRDRYHGDEDVHHSAREAGPRRHYYYYPREYPADQRPVSRDSGRQANREHSPRHGTTISPGGKESDHQSQPSGSKLHEEARYKVRTSTSSYTYTRYRYGEDDLQQASSAAEMEERRRR